MESWGYSLVEVSLALLVVAIGLLTIFALFPGGLDLSRKSVDATEVAAFAEFVFAGLDGMASSTNADDWNSFWNDMTNLPLTYMLTNLPPTQLYIRPMGNSTPQLFYWMPSFYEVGPWMLRQLWRRIRLPRSPTCWILARRESLAVMRGWKCGRAMYASALSHKRGVRGKHGVLS